MLKLKEVEGKIIHATFEKIKVEWDFTVPGTVKVRPLYGPILNHAPQQVDVRIAYIACSIFLVNWQELNQNIVVLVLDTERKTVWALISTAAHRLIYQTGFIDVL